MRSAGLPVRVGLAGRASPLPLLAEAAAAGSPLSGTLVPCPGCCSVTGITFLLIKQTTQQPVGFQGAVKNSIFLPEAMLLAWRGMCCFSLDRKRLSNQEGAGWPERLI